jgi:hypothetical protein
LEFSGILPENKDAQYSSEWAFANDSSGSPAPQVALSTFFNALVAAFVSLKVCAFF